MRRERSIIVRSPATGDVVWQGEIATIDDVRYSVVAARFAWTSWRLTTLEERIAVAERFAKIAEARMDELATVISQETGKPNWESIAEAKLIATKVRLAIAAHRQRSVVPPVNMPQGTGSFRLEPVGVMLVLGPFNFPAHLPNGHIVPAIIAGNVVVFKPSELTPGSGDLLQSFWQQAGLPPGVLQILHGDREIGSALLDERIDGVLFTGSHTAGVAIHRQLAGRPEVMLALEMGGNNPLIVDATDHLDAAAAIVVVSAFITAGQRCTCARRLILPNGPNVETLLSKITTLAARLVVGKPSVAPEPFMGPVISVAAGKRVLATQAEMLRRGGVSLLRASALADNPAMLTPGVIDVTKQTDREDIELFGPLLQVIRVDDFRAAIEEANATQFGLAAGLLSDDPRRFDEFRRNVRAGVLTWNQATVGASGQLPFGGLGHSGNHRPSGYAAAEYCSDAAASLETPTVEMPKMIYPGMTGHGA